MNDWTYKGKKFTPPDDFTSDDYYGFVYCITHLGTGKKYIGKKFFWSKKTLPITKTRKRRKRLLVESDWRDYWGSNDHLQKDVEELGPDKFTREILHFCPSRGVLSYIEAKEQFDRRVLETDEYYNGIINVRVGSSKILKEHLKNTLGKL